jgi:hypothetical protein
VEDQDPPLDGFGGRLHLPDGRKYIVASWQIKESWHIEFESYVDAEIQDCRDGEFYHFCIWFHPNGFERKLVINDPRFINMTARNEIWNYFNENRQIAPISAFAKSIHIPVGLPERHEI